MILILIQEPTSWSRWWSRLGHKININLMAKYNRNSGKQWTNQEVAALRRLAKQNTPTRVISLKLGRTPAAISTKASQEDISLDPPNRSPYGSKK